MTGDNPSVTPSTFEFTIGYHILPVGRRGGANNCLSILKIIEYQTTIHRFYFNALLIT